MKNLILLFLLLSPALLFAQGAGNRPLERFPKTNISLLSSASTQIGTTENGTEMFYPLLAVCEIMSSNVTVLTVPAIVSVGTNSPNYNNIVPATTLTSLYTLNSIMYPTLATIATSVPANTGIFVKVTAATVTGSTLNLRITLLGDYR
jgi:hypothetical protein